MAFIGALIFGVVIGGLLYLYMDIVSNFIGFNVLMDPLYRVIVSAAIGLLIMLLVWNFIGEKPLPKKKLEEKK